MSRSRIVPTAMLPTATAILLATTAGAFAQDAAPTIDTGDTAWMLTSTALVLLMTIPGLALFYGGMVRKKNVLATVMQSFAITCLMTVIWMIVGYSLAFTDGGGANAYVGGLSRFFLAGMGVDAVSGTIPESVFMMFQMTFAIITPALIAGGFRRPHEVLGDAVVHGSVVDHRLQPDRALGMGRRLPGRPRRARFRRRHGRAHQRRRRRPRLRARARQARRSRHRQHGAAQPGALRHRRLAAVGRLVRLQRRFRARLRRPRRHGDDRDPDRHRRRRARLDVHRVGRARQAERARHHLRCRRRPRRHHPGLRLGRPDRCSRHRHRRRRHLRLVGDVAEGRARLRRRARCLRRPRRRRLRRRDPDRRLRGLRGRRRGAIPASSTATRARSGSSSSEPSPPSSGRAWRAG